MRPGGGNVPLTLALTAQKSSYLWGWLSGSQSKNIGEINGPNGTNRGDQYASCVKKLEFENRPYEHVLFFRHH